MFKLLDDISELVYVADPETYELLYINESGREAFQIEEQGKGMKCYEVLQGRKTPCDFCTNSLLKSSEIYTWEFRNPITKRHYLLKDRLLLWEGKTARVEVAFDMTDLANKRAGLEKALYSEKVVLGCVRELYQEKNMDEAFNSMLHCLGEGLEAQRTYIFELSDDAMYNTYEWCAQGVKPEIDHLQKMDLDLIKRWRILFEKNECVVIRDMEEIKDISPLEYQILSGQGINSLVAVPLERSGELIGFIGVDNPPAERLENIAPLLDTLRYFLMITVQRIDDERKLREIGLTDMLTGLHNRNCYMEDIEQIKLRRSTIGVAFLDLNGLKEINDRKGHAAGDAALIYCAEKLREIFSSEMTYRIGGDEFVVIKLGDTEADFREKSVRLRQVFEEEGKYEMALGARWAPEATEVERLIQNADAAMYEDKRSFYRTHTFSSRYRKFSEESKLFGNSPLLKEYNMLMSAMKVSVSKHMLNEDFDLIWANDYYYETTGYTRDEYEELFHENVRAYFTEDPIEFQRLYDTVYGALKTGEPSYETILYIRQKSGNYVWIKVVGSFTDERIGDVPVIYTVITNISDLIKTQREQSITYDHLPGFVAKFRIGKDRPKFLYGNKKYLAFFGEAVNGEASQKMRDSLEKNWDIISKYYSRMRAGEPVEFEVEAEGIGSQNAVFRINTGCIDWIQEDPVYLIIFSDITEEVKQKERLRRIAYVDAVTGDGNKTWFEETAEKTVKSNAPGTYSLVSMDIQKFKVINDLFGIAGGDRTLKYVSYVMKKHLKEEEYCARISSDTFSLLLKENDQNVIVSRINSLVEDINSFNEKLEYKYLLTFTAGVYLIDENEFQITKMQDRANVARKKIKGAAGSGLCTVQVYDNEDRVRLAHEKEIENRMQDALKKGEFVVYYQPKQDLKTGQVAGAEALVRWKVPDKGLMPPQEFIPLFERNRFIVDVDLYVFEEVCCRIRRWIEMGLDPVPVSVNMSRAHLTDPNFLERYEGIRRKYNISPEFLEIEVTETLIFENPSLLSSVIDEIRKCGYRCSMDDFGSGNSSLNVLKNIHVDTLKLDRAFLESSHADEKRETDIICIVVEMARKLNMTTVAEGVETIEQAQFLKNVGCDILQGFLFSKPIPADEFEELLIKWKKEEI